MDPKSVTRKLSAILSADVQGYSRLMGDDEIATVETITEYRETISSLVTQWKGRVVDSPGDNILSEFASVVDAVQCAVEIQNVLKAKNEELPENRRMIFRIGVNLGDVIQEGDRIYGDGVNIASRIEGLADGGGICLSGTAYDQIENKLALGYDFIGEHSVKNINKPVRVYKVPMEPGERKEKKKRIKIWQWEALALLVLILAGAAFWNFYLRTPREEPASVEKMAFPLPDKPSIAVLPFDNMSGDPKQQYLCDGITEEIIASLAKNPALFVIARNSTSTYKGKPVRVQQVAEDLGVRYVLEGSVRKSEDRIRVTAQLIDALSGKHIWAEQYDRELKDIFAVQDDIVLQILGELNAKLTGNEEIRSCFGGTDNVAGYLKLLQGYDIYNQGTPEAFPISRKIFQEAVSLDPGYSTATTMIANTYLSEVSIGVSKSPKEDLEKAYGLITKALSMDSSCFAPHYSLSWYYQTTRQFENALKAIEKGVSLYPNNPAGYALLANILTTMGRADEAAEPMEKAMRLNPKPPFYFYLFQGFVRLGTGMVETAIPSFKKAAELAPYWIWPHFALAICYGRLDREEEARAEVAQILRLNPKASVEGYSKMLSSKDQAVIDISLDALRKAGLPEKPPFPLPDKPSIAVLPFENLSADPAQEYFSDGLTEDIITDLSKISGLFVIARNSVFTYKGKPTKIEQVSRELGVRYVLEGSVRKAGNEVRINAQLIDGTTGGHLWADRYDGKMDDIFSLQDRINKEIVTALKLKLTAGEQKNMAQKPTSSVEAYDYYLRGKEYLHITSRDSMEKAKSMFKKAIELDPNFAQAYIGVARANLTWLVVGHADLRKEAGQFITQALAIDGSLPEAHAILAQLRANDLHFEEAIASAARSVELDPNDPDSYVTQAYVLTMAGKHEDALKAMNTALRMNPIPPPDYEYILALVQFNRCQYAKTIESAKKAMASMPNFKPLLGLSIASHAYLGLTDKAGAQLKEFLKRFPWYSLTFLRDFSRYKLEKDSEHYVKGMEMAGMPINAFGYRYSDDNKLTVEEMKALLTGRKISGVNKTGDWWILHNKDGEMFSGGSSWGKDRGSYWFEKDAYWNKWEKTRQGRICSAVLIRNPKGTREKKNEYIFLINGIPFTFSPEE